MKKLGILIMSYMLLHGLCIGFAWADDDVFGKEYYKSFIKKEKFILASEYFEILQGCKWGYNNANSGYCAGSDDGAGNNIAFFKLKKPLKLKGKLTFNVVAPDECGNPELLASFTPDDSKFDFFTYPIRINIDNKDSMKQIERLLPQWYKNSLLGEFSLQVEFEVENRKEKIFFQGEPATPQPKPHTDEVGVIVANGICGAFPDSRINVKNLKVSKVSEHIKDWREDYNETMMRSLRGLKLNTNDDYVNLRQSPNGKIISKIYTKDKDKILLIEIYDNNHTWRNLLSHDKEDRKKVEAELNSIKKSKWRKVLYFPPNINKVSEAMIGYIHESQVSPIGFDGG